MRKWLDSLLKAAVKMRRKQLSRTLFQSTRREVIRGLFSGLKLDGDANISRSSLALKVFGLYEPAVFRAISQHGPYHDFVDIGAADGYFPLGLLRSGLVKKAFALELTQSGRDAIKRNARANGLEQSVTIMGAATGQLKEHLQSAGLDPHNALILCDIEGAEFEVLTPEMFSYARSATLIIELHDRVATGKPSKRDLLISRIGPDRPWYVVCGEPADWRGIPELEALSDNDRALVTSDGRKCLGEWLVVLPASEQI